jgi:alanyl-tRNA synthetase
MTSRDIRQRFIDFFTDRQHIVIPSSPVVPIGDPTLLFTNAGMNQFKDYFLGRATPPSPRVVNTQKCIRVSGKHNDLEEVGRSLYHHTFFEMLGNWSFGDYFKKEAIAWAWELATDVFGIPKDSLYATVFEGNDLIPADEEAEACWKSQTDIDPRHISRHGKKDNFWEMGDTGPCGPCSEIHIDRGEKFCNLKGTPHKCGVNGDCQRFTEIWNLVFIQYNHEENGAMTPLPQRHVDTGAGFERFCTILQNVTSNYDTDVFAPIISRICDLTGVPYSQGDEGLAHRVISDHIRCLTFAISDGVMPGNEGRGYVLRRILRRASRFARELGAHEPILCELVGTVVDGLGDVFPEIVDRREHAEMVIRAEEEAFGKTLDRGLEKYGEITAEIRKSKIKMISGANAFMLYDTYGFPLDLTELIAREDGFAVDIEGFVRQMEAQKERARNAQKFGEAGGAAIDDRFKVISQGASSDFVGYDTLECEAEIRKWFRDGDKAQFTLSRTPFYAEAGGQVGDQGIVEGKDFAIEVTDTIWAGDDRLHIGRLIRGTLSGNPAPSVHAKVDRVRREAIQRNHTVTHLLQAALRKMYGMHVHQAGSLVHPDYMRFDYTHVRKSTDEEIEEIERQINEWVLANIPLKFVYTTFKEALKQGVIAIFGEKYGKEVRVVEVPGVSKELCGGTHVRSTGDIGLTRIRSETAAAAGIRRMEVLTGLAAVKWTQDQTRTLDRMEDALQSHGSDPYEKLLKVLDERKTLEHDLEQLKNRLATQSMESLEDRVHEFVISPLQSRGENKGGQLDRIRYFADLVSVSSMDDLKHMGDIVRDKLGSGIGILGAVFDGRPAVVCVVTPDLIKAGIDVVAVAKAMGRKMGGGGGGKPHLATAGGKDPQLLESIIRNSEEIFREVGLGRKSPSQ